MWKITKRLKGLFIYLIGGYKTLSNWPAFFTDLIRIGTGFSTKCKFYKLRDGTKINVHNESKGLNIVFYSIYIKGEYDRLKDFEIQRDDIIVDIGAHLGFFTIKSAKKAINGKVYAFEPFSMHFKLLKNNIEQNLIKNVKLFNIAVSDKTGELTFYYTKEGDPSDTSLYIIKQDKKIYEEKVESISLNDLFQQEKFEVCNFLKLDCEGAEYSILMNADDSVLNKIQKIAMEWHIFHSDHNPKQLAEFLNNKGFKLIQSSPFNQRTGILHAYR